MSKAPGWPRPGGVSCAGRTPSARARLRATRERAGPGQFRPAPRFPGAGGRAVASSLAPWSSGQRRPERAGPLLPAASAGGPGSHRPPRHPALHGGDHALAAAAPAPRAQDPEAARENYKPASANRMLAALRGVLRECWHAGLISTNDYQAAARSRRCAGSRSRAASSRPVPGRLGRRLISQDAGARQRRDAAFLAIAYGSEVRGAEAIALDLADLGCASARARAIGPAWRLWPPRPSPPSRTGCRSGVGAGSPLLRRAQDRAPGPRGLGRPAPAKRLRGLGLSARSGARRRGSRHRPPTTCGGPGWATCSSWPIWPPCSGWPGTPRWPPLLGTTGAITPHSASGRPAACAVSHARRLNESEPCSNRRCAPGTKRAARCAPRLLPEAGAETGRLEDENTR
jgi:hypothetical protein